MKFDSEVFFKGNVVTAAISKFLDSPDQTELETSDDVYIKIYEKILEDNVIMFIDSSKNLLFMVDKENFVLVTHVSDMDKHFNIDYSWDFGIERYIQCDNEPEENILQFQKLFIKEMKEIRDYFEFIGEREFWYNNIDNFLINSF